MCFYIYLFFVFAQYVHVGHISSTTVMYLRIWRGSECHQGKDELYNALWSAQNGSHWREVTENWQLWEQQIYNGKCTHIGQCTFSKVSYMWDMYNLLNVWYVQTLHTLLVLVWHRVVPLCNERTLCKLLDIPGIFEVCRPSRCALCRICAICSTFEVCTVQTILMWQRTVTLLEVRGLAGPENALVWQLSVVEGESGKFMIEPST